MTSVKLLYERHHAELLRYAYRLCGDPDLAEDAAQEAFVRFADDRAAHTSNIRAWLFTVTTNLIRDAMRKANRQYRLLTSNPTRSPMADPPQPADQTLELEERREMVRRALENLSERDRTALLMREEGFSHREIAAATGTTTKAVGTILARALRKLARQLADCRGVPAYDN